MAADVPDTFAQLADIGYREVEFAGYFDHSPEEMRMFLDDLGLSSPSAHTMPSKGHGDGRVICRCGRWRALQTVFLPFQNWSFDY